MPDTIEDAIHELFAPLERRAPGSEASRARALALVPKLDARRRLLELGCGEGVATLQLAADLPHAHVVAVDLDAAAVARLRDRIAAAGLRDRVDARVADIRELSVESASVDLIWAEGSLYTIGLREGLALCRRLLAPDGIVVFTELVWLTPPGGARAFWAKAYPQMRTREQVEAELSAHGLVRVAAFVLPRSDWDAYYDPLRRRLDELRGRSEHVMQSAIAALREEIDVYDRFGEEYGYGCWIARSP